ncbi:hypothetical protein WMY93_034384, partial [Mugilogobius chulae]
MKTGLKLLLYLGFILAITTNSAAGLSCVTCDPNDSSCTVAGPYTCQNGETMCVSAIVTAWTATSGSSTQKIKGCAASTVCPATGSQDYSLD